MNVYQAIISKAKQSINEHFSHFSQSPEPRRGRRTAQSGKPASFKVTERIYTSEKQQFMQEVKLLSVPRNVKSPFRHLRVPKSFEAKYSQRRGGKGLGSRTALSQSRIEAFTGSPEMRRSTGSSPNRSPGLTINRSVRLHSIMDICDQTRVKAALLTEVRKKQTQAKHYNERLHRTGQALEVLTDSPVEVLEPLYQLHKESDLALRRDAAGLTKEGEEAMEDGENQVKMMLARGRRSRRSASQS